jgi:hypothetical protein
MQLKMEDGGFVKRPMFSDEATFHTVARWKDTMSVCGEPSNHMHRQSTSGTLQKSTNVRVLLCRALPQRWIGRAANGDNNLLHWPPRSLDLTPCDFFLWGFVKVNLYVPPLPTPIQELSDRITHALQAITADKLHWVWDEFDYCVDVCCVTQGANIEGL